MDDNYDDDYELDEYNSVDDLTYSDEVTARLQDAIDDYLTVFPVSDLLRVVADLL